MSDDQRISRLLDIMAALRNPETGCPWDIEQTSQSISHYTIEEAYEVADAIERKDTNDLQEELGDLLLQVVFHSKIAEDEGKFNFGDVVETISDKMVRRHPHVFGSEEQRKQGAQKGFWENIKAQEKAQKETSYSGYLSDVIVKLPALSRAVKLQKKAAHVGFDWPDIKPVFAKIREELDELNEEIESNSSNEKIEEEYGDLLFVLANLARHLKFDPEASLRSANQKFIRRFHQIEKRLKDNGSSLETATLEEMDRVWDEVKEQENNK